MNTDRFNPSYLGRRNDILELIPLDARTVLDVGCSIGTLGDQIKHRNEAEVIGIELDQKMAVLAREKLDRVITGNIEQISLRDHLSTNCFDCIVFGDVLEHLRDPWSVLKRCTDYLGEDGCVIASIPNIRHYTTILSLLAGYWPYRERGIHDQTHLRFFTLRNIEEIFQGAGMKIVELRRKYRIIERPHRYNKYSKYLAVRPLKEFLTFQYLIVAKFAQDYNVSDDND